jgi:hypothetical protein
MMNSIRRTPNLAVGVAGPPIAYGSARTRVELRVAEVIFARGPGARPNVTNIASKNRVNRLRLHTLIRFSAHTNRNTYRFFIERYSSRFQLRASTNEAGL